MGSNSLGFPKPAGPRPETRLAGYKWKRAIDQNFPFQCIHYAASPDGAASPRQRRLHLILLVASSLLALTSFQAVACRELTGADYMYPCTLLASGHQPAAGFDEFPVGDARVASWLPLHSAKQTPYHEGVSIGCRTAALRGELAGADFTYSCTLLAAVW
jgi:hypothetical protein